MKTAKGHFDINWPLKVGDDLARSRFEAFRLYVDPLRYKKLMVCARIRVLPEKSMEYIKMNIMSWQKKYLFKISIIFWKVIVAFQNRYIVFSPT